MQSFYVFCKHLDLLRASKTYSDSKVSRGLTPFLHFTSKNLHYLGALIFKTFSQGSILHTSKISQHGSIDDNFILCFNKDQRIYNMYFLWLLRFVCLYLMRSECICRSYIFLRFCVDQHDNKGRNSFLVARICKSLNT